MKEPTPKEWYLRFREAFLGNAEEPESSWKTYLEWYRRREEHHRVKDKAWTILMGEFLFRFARQYGRTLGRDLIQEFELDQDDFVWTEPVSGGPVVHVEYENDSDPPTKLESEVVRIDDHPAELNVLMTYDGGKDSHRKLILDVVGKKLRDLGFARQFLLVVGGILDRTDDWKGFAFLNREWSPLD